MFKISTIILRLALLLMTIIVIALCFFFVPAAARVFVIEFPQLANLKFFIYFVPYASAVFFYIAIFSAWRLIDYIDKGTAISNSSIKALNVIKYCGFGICIAYASGMPTMYYIADAEDAPGLILIAGVITLIPFVISIFAVVLQGLLKEVIHKIETEN